MNIKNFDSYISKTILQRGYDYYNEGNILEMYRENDNEFIFQVQGSEDYEVVVKLNENGEIQDTHCDCPYDLGPICKHEVAAYFKLFEILNGEDTHEIEKRELGENPKINEVLSSLSKEDLINILIELTRNDEILKNSLIVKYSKGNDGKELEDCKILIESIVRKYTGREGFIAYRETYRFVCEMDELLQKVRDTEDTRLALEISFLILNEAVGAFQYADDSNGDIGSLVTETIELIEEIAIDSHNLDSNLREEMFNKILEQSQCGIFDDWVDYKIELLRSCAKFADEEAHIKN